MIKFNKHNVTNGTHKARVQYSIGDRVDGTNTVTLYAKDGINDLNKIFNEEYRNDSDSSIDYFEKGKVVIFEDNPLWEQAAKMA